MLTEEHVYGATKLSDEEWIRLSQRYERWTFVLVENGHATADGTWLQIMGLLYQQQAEGRDVRAIAHSDYVRRIVEFLAAE